MPALVDDMQPLGVEQGWSPHGEKVEDDMGDSSAGLHEEPSKLAQDTVNQHRAIVSLMEELEAVDWYNQRVDATPDDSLSAILAHNRDEEKEHAAMLIEWLRRNDEGFEKQLRRYLFTEEPIVDLED